MLRRSERIKRKIEEPTLNDTVVQPVVKKPKILVEEVSNPLLDDDKTGILNDDSDSDSNTLVSNNKSVETILAYRLREGVDKSQPDIDEEVDIDKNMMLYLHRYEILVKWKGKSHRHCKWVYPNFILENERMGKARLKKFFKKYPEENPEEPFDEEYTEVHRIIDVEYRDDRIYYLVKWKYMSYDEVTWENKKYLEDYDFEIENYHNRSKIPDDIGIVPKPALESIDFLPEDYIYKNDNQLKSYQAVGLNWLLLSYFNGTNNILADEMGLGKTVQSIAVLDFLSTRLNIRGPFLIIVPLSTINNWEREIMEWSDMNPVIYHGSSNSRKIIRDFEFHYFNEDDEMTLPEIYKFNVLLTSYEIFTRDIKHFKKIEWRYCIIDEAHKLKNRNSVFAKQIREIDYEHLTLLTGTPIQNNPSELWSLLNLLDIEKFPSIEDFEKNFGNLKELEQVTKLQEVIKPYLLRRVKEEVEDSIAEKEETVIEVELTLLQKKYYRAILEKNFDHLCADKKKMPSLMNVVMQLRKCCNHPYLLKGVEERENDDHDDHDTTYLRLIQSSGKVVLIDKLVDKLVPEGHKILIFSQLRIVLNILEDYFNYKKLKYERIDGSINGMKRQSAIDRFTNDKDITIFLLCTRAGGQGINLTAADTVVIFDSDWNPQNDLQAQARAHRIGQEKKVQVYRLVTRGTYEQKMFDIASKKLGLDQAVLSNMVTDDELKNAKKTRLTKNEIEHMLKYGAYDVFKDGDTTDNFCEEDIDLILANRTRKIVHEAEAKSSFSKATFSSNSTSEIDINDPEFWSKVLPESVTKELKKTTTKKKSQKEIKTRAKYEGGETLRMKQVSWTRAVRNRFQKYIMLFGISRCDILNEKGNLKKSQDEIELYIQAYLRLLFKNLTVDYTLDDIYEKLVNNTKSLIPEGENIYTQDIFLKEDRFLKKIAEKAEEFYNRICLISIIEQSIQFLDEIPDEDFIKPTGTWGRVEDIDLLKGICKHGYGNFKLILNDEQLIFHSKFYDKKKAKEEVVDPVHLLPFPLPKTLNKRLSKLVHMITPHTAFKDIYTTQEPDQEELPVPPKATWTKKEQGTIYKTVITLGIPYLDSDVIDITTLQKKLKLQKTDQDVLDYIRDLVLYCKTDESVEECETIFSYSQFQKTRLLDRITIFRFIRENILSLHENLIEQKLRPFIDLKKLTKWWIPIEHDIGLLQAIDIHGLGMWEDIFQDTNLPFRQVIEENLTDIENFWKKINQKRGRASRKLLAEVAEIPTDARLMKRILLIKKFFEEVGIQIIPINNEEQIGDFESNPSVVMPMDIGDEIYEDFLVQRMGSVDVEKDLRLDQYGCLIFPLKMGSLTVFSMGKIVLDRSGYHNSHYIWPIGFSVSREFISYKNKSETGTYVCEIIDDGMFPLFVISPLFDQTNKFTGTTPQEAWDQVFEQLHLTFPSHLISPEELFGMEPTVRSILSQMPNTNFCFKYGKLAPLEGNYVPIPVTTYDLNGNEIIVPLHLGNPF